jgi:hypothetical protein
VQFSQLYGIELDRELGSSSTALFTTARRKAAINAAQLEWVKRTECLIKETSVSLVDDTQEYDLEVSITDLGWVSKQGIRIAITSGTTTRYLEGDDLRMTSIERLAVDEAGWRAASAGTPTKWYIRRDGGRLYLGLHPKPSIDGTDTWVAVIPYVIQPADLSADADEPFTVSSNIPITLRPWHRALAHFAAFDLEKLRKDTARQQAQLALWEAEVQRFLGNEKPKNGSVIRMARNYRRTQPVGWRRDPRVC